MAFKGPKMAFKRGVKGAAVRANLLHDTIGAAKTLDDKPGLELEFIARAS